LRLLALAFLLALPDAEARRYRMEIAGEPVGVASLRLSCDGRGCRATFESEARLPEASGAGVARRRVEVDTDREGRAREARAGGARRLLPAGHAASILAEALLSVAADGERRCLAVVDEETGRAGSACATRHGAWLEGEVLGERRRFRAAPGRLPDEVVLPAQGVRFVADERAAVPPRAPGTLGAAVPAPPGAEEEHALRFCGLAPEAEDPEPPPLGLSRDWPEEGSCREKAAAYLRLARRDGIDGRHVVGVAWDGRQFVWHEWVELGLERRWVAVDPSFRQVPASGPRFAVARFADGDEAARAEAGRRILACWGKARVERAPPP
jgi:hypothetical protein